MGRLLRYVRFPLLCCALGLVAVFVSHGGFSPAGLEATWITLVLLALPAQAACESLSWRASTNASKPHTELLAL